jgi:hypothetical protein
MKLLWTRSKTPLSAMIRWMTDSDCSHFAIHFETLGLVLQSNLIGVHLAIVRDFVSVAEVIHFADVKNITPERESSICLLMMKEIAGRGYGFKALLYFAWRQFLKKFFNKELPEKNSWADSREFLCTMIYDKIPDDVIPTFPRLDHAAMVTPHMLYEAILNSHSNTYTVGNFEG